MVTGPMLDSGKPPPRREPEPKPAPEKPKLASWLTGDFDTSSSVPNQFTETLSRAAAPGPSDDIAPQSFQQLLSNLAERTSGGSFNLLAPSVDPATGEPVVQESEADKQRADARELAEQQLGLNDPKRNKVYRMTDEEYLALSPKQRAAIDFNTALVSAVRQDKRNQELYGRSVSDTGMVIVHGGTSAGAEQRKLYEQDLESMFGSDRGSDFYAPATVALLKDIGYKNENADLDDFLNLKVAITDKDLKNFNAEYGTGTKEYTLSGVPGIQTEESQGYVLNGKIVDSPKFEIQNQLVQGAQTRLQELLDKGDMLLGNTFNTMAQARSGTVQSYGGVVPQLQGAGGYNGPNAKQFEAVFEELGSNKANTTKESLSALSQMWAQNGVDPDEFWTYANSRIDQAALEGGTLGSVGYQPDEMRKLLGLEPKGG